MFIVLFSCLFVRVHGVYAAAAHITVARFEKTCTYLHVHGMTRRRRGAAPVHERPPEYKRGNAREKNK